MKLRKQDWLLIAAIVIWLVFAGPFLISARDWILVALGFGSLFGLIFWIVTAVRFHMGTKTNA